LTGEMDYFLRVVVQDALQPFRHGPLLKHPACGTAKPTVMDRVKPPRLCRCSINDRWITIEVIAVSACLIGYSAGLVL
jgi:hypothetical protein